MSFPARHRRFLRASWGAVCDSELFDDGGGGGRLHSGRSMSISALASSTASGDEGFAEALGIGLSHVVGAADMSVSSEEPAPSSITRGFSDSSLESDEDSDRRGSGYLCPGVTAEHVDCVGVSTALSGVAGAEPVVTVLACSSLCCSSFSTTGSGAGRAEGATLAVVAGVPRATAEKRRGPVQSLVAWAWPQRRHGAVQPSVVWPNTAQRLQRGVVQVFAKCPSMSQRLHTRRIPRYSAMTRYPSTTRKFGTGRRISMRTTRVPVLRSGRSLNVTWDIALTLP